MCCNEIVCEHLIYPNPHIENHAFPWVENKCSSYRIKEKSNKSSNLINIPPWVKLVIWMAKNFNRIYVSLEN